MLDPIIFAFSGRSNSGKTTLICRLCAYLREREGARIAVIKHDPKDKASFDTKGKDSALFFATSEAVAVISPTRTTLQIHHAKAPYGETSADSARESCLESQGVGTPLDSQSVQNHLDSQSGGEAQNTLESYPARDLNPTQDSQNTQETQGARDSKLVRVSQNTLDSQNAPESSHSPHSLEEEAAFRRVIEGFKDYDYIFIEGLKYLPYPRIVVAREEVEEGYIAYASAFALGKGARRAELLPPAMPCFALDDIEGIARFVRGAREIE